MNAYLVLHAVNEAYVAETSCNQLLKYSAASQDLLVRYQDRSVAMSLPLNVCIHNHSCKSNYSHTV